MASASNGRIAVAGPNGSLGPTVIKHLQQNNFDITLLSRDPEKTSQQWPSPTKTVKADYDSVEQLTQALKEAGPFDSIVVLINRNVLDPQLRLIDAAIAAGIPHIIPSAFGGGTRDPHIRACPPLEEKVKMEDYLDSKAKAGLITFSAVNTGAFLDWALDRGFFLNMKPTGPPTLIPDGGDVLFSVSTMDFIGDAVAKTLMKRNEPEMKNMDVFVHHCALSINQLLKYAKEVAPERVFRTSAVDTAEVEKEAWENVRKGDRSPMAMRGFLLRATLGLGLNNFKEVHNEYLGLPTWTEDDVKGLLKKYV